MPYQGNIPATQYQGIPSVQQFSGNGSTTTFTLNQSVSNIQSVLVSVDGVVQDANESYTIPDGTTLTFTAAPSSGTDNIFVNYLSKTLASVDPTDEFKGNFKGNGMFRTNGKNLSSDITITSSENANVTGPLTVDSGVTLTVESGGTLVTL